MAGTLTTRAENMALSDPTRKRVWDFLKDEGRPFLRDAADAGRVPVTALSASLIDRFGAEALDPAAMRQFIGIAVSAILHEEGFAIARAGVRLRGDPLFGAGSLFERVRPAPDESNNPLLVRIIDALSDDELAFAERLIRKRLQALPRQTRPQARPEADGDVG